MTDFGRPAGVGDMLKSVYDPDLDGDVDALATHKTSHQDGGSDEIDVTDLSGELADDQPPKEHPLAGNKHTSATLAQLNAEISDATLDKDTDTRTPTAHKTSHQDGGSDEINVAGLTGTTPRAILGDATPGRVLRYIQLEIANGTTGATLKCTIADLFNGDVVSSVDNISKDATTDGFTLSADGQKLTIEAAILSGNVLYAMAVIGNNATEVLFAVTPRAESNDIFLNFTVVPTGDPIDLTTLVDTGKIWLHITYITDA